MAPDGKGAKRGGRVKWWLGLALMGCVVVMMFGMAMSSRDGGTATPTAQVARAAVTVAPAEPTRTPQPGKVTVAPSETPVTEPTATEAAPTKPVPTATAEFSAEESQYVSDVLVILADLQDANNTMTEKATAASLDASLILNNEWRMDMGIALGTIQVCAKRFQQLKAPPRFTAVQREIVTAAQEYDAAASLYIKGIDSFDGELLTQGTQRYATATAALQRATAELQKVKDGEPASASGPTAAKDANLRAGPGTDFAKAGSVPAGFALAIVGRTEAGDWFELEGGKWIAAFLVANPPGSVPVSSSIPAPASSAPASRAAGAVAVATPSLPTAELSTCDCSGNLYNCDDFQAFDAQACYLRCLAGGAGDVHGLDGDTDGSACEWEY